MAAKTLLAMLASAVLVLSANAITCPSLAAGDIVRRPYSPFCAGG
jgi:hypothetical protein